MALLAVPTDHQGQMMHVVEVATLVLVHGCCCDKGILFFSFFAKHPLHNASRIMHVLIMQWPAFSRY
jgi:hypothetical protein